MSLALGVPHSDHPYRPSLRRSRSQSNPTPSPNAQPDSDPPPPTRPERPTHGRSHSYLSSTALKPRNASTLPASGTTSSEKIIDKDKHRRIHIPGKEHLHRNLRHRYTQSEAEHHHRQKRHAENESLPNLVAGLKAESEKRGVVPGHHELNSGVPGSLTHMISTRSYRATASGAGAADPRPDHGPRGDLRGRTTSDPKQATGLPARTKKRSAIEEDLERADRMRRQRKFTITKADVSRRDREIEEAEAEIRERLAEINSKGIEITRRLDYGYYNLLDKAGNLVSTIQSFQSLAQQSKQLIANFEHETQRLEGDMGKRVGNFKKGFEGREVKVDRLETRGKELGLKAEDLGRRLENARTVVENWQRREDQAKKVWGRFLGGLWWTFVSVIVLILAIVIGKEWWFRGDVVKAGLKVPPGGSWDGSLNLGEGKLGELQLKGADLPDDVRSLLEGIEERNRKRKNFFPKPAAVNENKKDEGADDSRLGALDEL